MNSTRRDFCAAESPWRADRIASSQTVPAAGRAASAEAPWYTRCYRWAQVNTTQKDFVQYDLAWWREQWKRTAVQAFMVNAVGAEFAQYPSKNPLLPRNLFCPTGISSGKLSKRRIGTASS